MQQSETIFNFFSKIIQPKAQKMPNDPSNMQQWITKQGCCVRLQTNVLKREFVFTYIAYSTPEMSTIFYPTHTQYSITSLMIESNGCCYWRIVNWGGNNIVLLLATIGNVAYAFSCFSCFTLCILQAVSNSVS